MAKDKNKNTAAADDDFARPSTAPSGGDGWKLTEEGEGRLLLFTPLREDVVTTGDYGDKDIVVADVVVIDEKHPEKSEEHDEVFVFGGYLKGALRARIGKQKVLGRLVRGTVKERGNYPWKLEDPTDADVENARAALAALNDPFRVTGGADEAEEKPKAKKDKSGKKPKA